MWRTVGEVRTGTRKKMNIRGKVTHVQGHEDNRGVQQRGVGLGLAGGLGVNLVLQHLGGAALVSGGLGGAGAGVVVDVAVGEGEDAVTQEAGLLHGLRVVAEGVGGKVAGERQDAELLVVCIVRG